MKNIIYFTFLCLGIFSYAQSGRTNPNLKPPTSGSQPTEAPSVEKVLTEEEKQKIIDDLNNGRQQRSTTNTSTQSSNNTNSENSNRWVFGGNLGLNFGRFTNITISPRIGYQFSQYLIGGIDVGYTYASVENSSQTNMFNGGAFLQPIIQDFFGIINFMYYAGNQKSLNSSVQFNNTINEPVLWLGGGYRARIGGSAFTTLGMQYNVLHNDKSIFGQAWQPMAGVQMGF